ncbi:hypothetical protein A8C56_16670 [Niabella ginsenosidivorans]|uniref:Uncharacterized protein n=1 Tax=Niabella ginsenosidivorans TaxID=1176587 RepID=A0A1A9I6P9_9BACT|nr:type VI secretion system baseplate subunit TssF [Niabella ginsenosidivorans]ANH82380.1 hypothetical protein A8C56_16670 [Niabella ginsenosidivorans]
MNESREHIRNRMLQNAAKIWGYAETEEASSFDPLVGLLLSANAAELERLSNEIYHSRNRVMERIVQLLAPDVLTGPRLASAILNANSLEDVAVLSTKEQFFITQNVRSSTDEAPRTTDIFFTPTDNFIINKCKVRFAATGNKIYRYPGGVTKELMGMAEEQQWLAPSVLWIAVDQKELNLNNTQFYFQYRSEVNRAIFYNQLKNTGWKVAGHPLNIHKGYNVSPNNNPDWYATQLIQQEASATTRYIKLVNELYEESFVSIKDPLVHQYTAEEKEIPGEIKTVFGTRVLQALNEPLCWIRISFPENITSTMLEDVSVFSNCFPVVNRRLHEITYRVQEMINVIPLLTGDDQFYDLGEITDETGRFLHTRQNTEEDAGKMSILLRNGGAGRFDERDATVVIENLVQLLRDESAAFSKLGKDLISQEIKTLQQSITKIEQLVGENTGNQSAYTPYLMIRNQKQTHSRFLYIEYWSTNGYAANGLRPGTRLQPYKTGSVNHSSVFLLTNTQNGKNRLSQTDSVVAYKYALLSKDRVMSRNDIILYCKLFLGNMVQEVKVEKGFMVSPETTKGFMKTIDVTVALRRKEFIEAQEKGEIAQWEKELAAQLTERSMAFIPYRVFIKEAPGF